MFPNEQPHGFVNLSVHGTCLGTAGWFTKWPEEAAACQRAKGVSSRGTHFLLTASPLHALLENAGLITLHLETSGKEIAVIISPL